MTYQGQSGPPWDETGTGGEPAAAGEGLLETVVSVLTRPVPTLRRLTARPRVGWAVVVTVAIALLTWVAAAAQFRTGPPGAGGLPPELAQLRGAFVVAAVVGGPFISLIGLAVWAAILHGVSLLLRGEGSYPGLFTGLAFANVPSTLTVIGQLLALAGVAGALLGRLVNLALAAWVLVLGVIAVRENYGFSTGKAIAAWLIPFGILLGLVIVVIIVLFAAFFGAGG